MPESKIDLESHPTWQKVPQYEGKIAEHEDKAEILDYEADPLIVMICELYPSGESAELRWAIHAIGNQRIMASCIDWSITCYIPVEGLLTGSWKDERSIRYTLTCLGRLRQLQELPKLARFHNLYTK